MAHSSRYSSQVRMYIKIGDEVLNVSDCLVNECFVRNPIQVPAQTLARFIISIDDFTREQEIILSNGISANDSRVVFELN